MKLNRQKLLSLYMRDVNKISQTCDWKSQFGPEEIVGMICSILENEYFSPIKELIETRKKLLPEWSQETSDFVDELYSRLEWAETENAVFNLRLKKQWTAGSNLYVEKDLTEAYNQGYKDGSNHFYGEDCPKGESQVPACPKCGEKMIFIDAVDFNGWSCVHTAGCVFHLRAFNHGF